MKNLWQIRCKQFDEAHEIVDARMAAYINRCKKYISWNDIDYELQEKESEKST